MALHSNITVVLILWSLALQASHPLVSWPTPSQKRWCEPEFTRHYVGSTNGSPLSIAVDLHHVRGVASGTIKFPSSRRITALHGRVDREGFITLRGGDGANEAQEELMISFASPRVLVGTYQEGHQSTTGIVLEERTKSGKRCGSKGLNGAWQTPNYGHRTLLCLGERGRRVEGSLWDEEGGAHVFAGRCSGTAAVIRFADPDEWQPLGPTRLRRIGDRMLLRPDTKMGRERLGTAVSFIPVGSPR